MPTTTYVYQLISSKVFKEGLTTPMTGLWCGDHALGTLGELQRGKRLGEGLCGWRDHGLVRSFETSWRCN